jgi:hypothetical protein
MLLCNGTSGISGSRVVRKWNIRNSGSSGLLEVEHQELVVQSRLVVSSRTSSGGGTGTSVNGSSGSSGANGLNSAGTSGSSGNTGVSFHLVSSRVKWNIRIQEGCRLLVHQGTNGLNNFRYIRKFRNTGVSSFKRFIRKYRLKCWYIRSSKCQELSSFQEFIKDKWIK